MVTNILLLKIVHSLYLCRLIMLFQIFILAFLIQVHFCFKIGVCITGMPARFQPHHLLEFFKLNSDNTFHLFYRFQDDSSLFFSTKPKFSYSPSIYASYNSSILEENLRDLYSSSNNVRIESIQYTKPKSRKEWLTLMSGNLGAITQFVYQQEKILNMFEKADQCGQDIIKFQNENSIQFDYIIHTREDIYLLKNILLNEVLSKYPTCDWIGKDCLTWWGLSQRFAIMKPEPGLQFLSKKIGFFESLNRQRRRVYNTESFDLELSKQIGMKTCAVSIEDIPFTAARHTVNGSFCLIPEEIDRCYPESFEPQLDFKRCK